MVRLYPLRRRRRNPKLAKAFKWLIPLILFGCQLEPETVYVEVPVLLETTDTLFVTREASFALVTVATMGFITDDTVACTYEYSVTKLDTIPVDSLFVIGFLLEWNDEHTSATIMDSTRKNIWPVNSRDWTTRWAYSSGSFKSNNKWATGDWPTNVVKYSMGLEY